MAPIYTSINPVRIRSYLVRLPIVTRLVLFLIVALFFLSILLPWIPPWGALTPSKVNLATLHRLSTYPLLHVNLFHIILNLLALTPLLERFEAEHGSLNALILFSGPFSTFPGAVYVLLEKLLRLDSSVMGSSIWIFLLLASEAMKTHRVNPNFSVGPYSIPTWTTPLIMVVVVTFIVPNTSLLGHLCGAGMGYLWGLNYIRFLLPPDGIVRFLEDKLDLLRRLPHYVSLDQKTYGRFGVLPSTASGVTVGSAV
ncbi:hypothetical protein P152DRAFT_443767 [Eremomyces bilateralis CBS 781.70]|uniref:rhomboid protease n=1 Tax=Eremomyces bilateralis CBS 781.70 TaxID=1392243 RepID=A0A6G1FRS7_9PEZI|nr:uncharacterized protein P152DRAFT_443767 [Eremomyces bilateralis CBS 781.70]KAF1808494.1 hypothetical protein P152DRAFT_443767 [Eremomyces bilateralis CBS 781.70]